MEKHKISIKSARRIVLHAQLLDDKTKLPKGKEGVAQTIETLGYVQIDTINVIERAHHHTLWNRRPDYHPDMLHELQAKDRRVFEYWGHAHSYLPMSDYRYYLRRMREYENPHSKWEKQQMDKYGHLMEPMMERIRNEGPLSSKDFESAPESERKPMWHPKPARAALSLLVWKVELMISERRNNQKVFDLTERVLPDNVDTSVPDPDELGQFLVRRALSALGVATEKEIRNHIDAAGKEVISKSLNDLEESVEVIRVKIKGLENIAYYAFLDTIEKSTKQNRLKDKVILLSPFDNLIIQRDRIKRLFDFEYALECYTPPVKRDYGYYVLPILWGDQLVGRLDPKTDRKEKTLIIRNLVFETNFKEIDKFLPAFADSMGYFARFNNCERIVFEKISPANLQKKLEQWVKEPGF